MSWEAKKWAEEQQVGDPMLKWILIATCNFSNKRTGKIYATPHTVADFMEHPRPQSIAEGQKKLAALGKLIDTEERTGRNGRTIVWLPAYWQKKRDLTDNTLATH